jgi:hypothetical protein
VACGVLGYRFAFHERMVPRRGSLVDPRQAEVMYGSWTTGSRGTMGGQQGGNLRTHPSTLGERWPP